MPKRIQKLWICAAICILCVGIMIVVYLQGPRQEVRFTPPPFDTTAMAGVPELTEADGYRAIDAQAYKFSICGELRNTEGKADIWLTNDAENHVWLKVVLKDSSDRVLGETGLIRPGEYVQSILLDEVPEETAEVTMVVMGYEPDTYYSVGNVTLYTALEI